MKTLWKSFKITIAFCIFFSLFYILVLWIFAQFAGPNKGNAEVATLNGKVVGAANVGNSKSIPIVVTTASGSCSKEELIGRGFAGCLFKPFSISELMEITDKCALSSILDEKPDFSTLLSYGNESVMLDKLIAETEKEMQAVKDAEQRKDLQELDTLTHHLRSSWQILRADQPLRELYAQLHGSATPDDEAICKAVTGCAG